MILAAQSLERFGSGVSELQAALSRLRSRPNFFRTASRVIRVEGVHSDLLAWLLDPQEWHGLGDSFAVPFIQAALGACPLSIADPITIGSVQKEYGTGKGPVDILVELTGGGTAIVLAIENKIDAGPGDDQLQRYADGLAARFQGKARVALVLLAPEDRPTVPPQSEFCAFGRMTYASVVRALDAAVSGSGTASAGAGPELARHYLELLRTDIVPESSPEVDRVLRDLASQRDAWRLIRRRLPSETDDRHAALAAALCTQLSATFGPPWRFAIRRERYVRVFRPCWSSLGFTDADPVLGLSDADYAASRYPHAHFRLTARPDDDTAERWLYIAKLRLDTRRDDALGNRLRQDLIGAGFLRSDQLDQQQLTPPLKQTAKLPGTDVDAPPDAVVRWFFQQLEQLVPLLDAHLGRE